MRPMNLLQSDAPGWVKARGHCYCIQVTSDTSLFPQVMTEDICIQHWNIIHKSIGVA